MYKQHVLDIDTLENRVRDVVDDLENSIQLLESQLGNLGLDACDKTLSKFKETSMKVQDITEKLLKRNTQLEQTIKVQAAKIKTLEATILQMRKEITTSKEEQAKNAEHLQKQIDDIKRKMADKEGRIETKMRNIITVVMAANNFKEPLGTDSSASQ